MKHPLRLGILPAALRMAQAIEHRARAEEAPPGRAMAEAPKVGDKLFGLRIAPGSVIRTTPSHFLVQSPVRDAQGQLTGQTIHLFDRMTGVPVPAEQVEAMLEDAGRPQLVSVDGEPL